MWRILAVHSFYIYQPSGRQTQLHKLQRLVRSMWLWGSYHLLLCTVHVLETLNTGGGRLSGGNPLDKDWKKKKLNVWVISQMDCIHNGQCSVSGKHWCFFKSGQVDSNADFDIRSINSHLHRTPSMTTHCCSSVPYWMHNTVSTVHIWRGWLCAWSIRGHTLAGPPQRDWCNRRLTLLCQVMTFLRKRTQGALLWRSGLIMGQWRCH